LGKSNNEWSKKDKKYNFSMSLFLLVVGYRFHVDYFGFDILSDLFDLEFPEMGCFDLDLAPGHGDNPVLWRFDSLADFLAFTDINLHNCSSYLLIPFNPIIFLKGI